MGEFSVVAIHYRKIANYRWISPTVMINFLAVMKIIGCLLTAGINRSVGVIGDRSEGMIIGQSYGASSRIPAEAFGVLISASGSTVVTKVFLTWQTLNKQATLSYEYTDINLVMQYDCNHVTYDGHGNAI
ncbi:hypothetical protein IEQ34_021764 [Dendrobium chrysotoxum]|uniref:Uncharacterized protein n=1 Tax=Dendrobium chrysotoxum TaxID=161865 RepID=A0AAV7G5P2_DENCH|nr:hypothetical protein IEQ34_021764 [Dendrobium chrysotoxum]